MDWYRIVNFVMQLAYLIAHAVFIFRIWRKGQATPIWYWFVFFSIGVWVWVSGRFLETIGYIFMPQNNDFYVFAANYQYLGNTTACVGYVFWNLCIAGKDKLAKNFWFRILLFTYPVLICTLVFTNEYHHLMYTKLVMGERVHHGAAFKPLLVMAYVILLFGYFVAISHFWKNPEDRWKKILMISAYPVLPAVAVLIRSLSGIDKLDYTPVVVFVSFYCLYWIIFKLNYVHVIPASIQTIMAQTAHCILIYDLSECRYLYVNHPDSSDIEELKHLLLSKIGASDPFFSMAVGEKSYEIRISSLPSQNSLLVTAADMTEIMEQQRLLDAKIQESERLNRELEEEHRNIDAYLDSLYRVEGVKGKQELIEEAYQQIDQAFRSMEENLRAAKARPEESELPLSNNLRIAEDCIGSIRQTVVKLREG